MANKLNIPAPQVPHNANSNVNNFPYIPTPLEIINQYLRILPSPQEPINKPALNITQPPLNTMPQFAGAALNGTPIYSNLEIEAASWTDMSTNTTKSFQEMSFNTVLISVRQNKDIVETKIQGSDQGAVLEYSGLNNYDITINLIITGSNGVYPQSDMENIIAMLNAPIDISISCWYLNTLNVYRLVIRSYDISQEPGGISQQAITIQAQSTNNTVLVIQN